MIFINYKAVHQHDSERLHQRKRQVNYPEVFSGKQMT
jgi:hypothetical protein